jgi:glycine cleavage system H protein
MFVPDDLRYLPSHEWCRLEGDEATFGITAYAQDQLGDVVYIDLPAVGTVLAAGQAFGAIESVKAASDLCAPLSGTVVAVNDGLDSSQEAVNEDPYGAGWMVRVQVAAPAEWEALLAAPAYADLCASDSH